MITGVPCPGIAAVARAVLFIFSREAAQSKRREQVLFESFDHTDCAFSREYRIRQTYSKDLIRPDGAVFVLAIHDVEQTPRTSVPEQIVKTCLGTPGHVVE